MFSPAIVMFLFRDQYGNRISTLQTAVNVTVVGEAGYADFSQTTAWSMGTTSHRIAVKTGIAGEYNVSVQLNGAAIAVESNEIPRLTVTSGEYQVWWGIFVSLDDLCQALRISPLLCST